MILFGFLEKYIDYKYSGEKIWIINIKKYQKKFNKKKYETTTIKKYFYEVSGNMGTKNILIKLVRNHVGILSNIKILTKLS